VDVADGEVHQQLFQRRGLVGLPDTAKGFLNIADHPLDLDTGSCFEAFSLPPSVGCDQVRFP
jgi:hypothetical protein